MHCFQAMSDTNRSSEWKAKALQVIAMPILMSVFSDAQSQNREALFDSEMIKVIMTELIGATTEKSLSSTQTLESGGLGLINTLSNPPTLQPVVAADLAVNPTINTYPSPASNTVNSAVTNTNSTMDSQMPNQSVSSIDVDIVKVEVIKVFPRVSTDLISSLLSMAQKHTRSMLFASFYYMMPYFHLDRDQKD
jgi:hypothetical protein